MTSNQNFKNVKYYKKNHFVYTKGQLFLKCVRKI